MQPDMQSVTMVLRDTDETMAMWPHKFEVSFSIAQMNIHPSASAALNLVVPSRWLACLPHNTMHSRVVGQLAGATQCTQDKVVMHECLAHRRSFPACSCLQHNIMHACLARKRSWPACKCLLCTTSGNQESPARLHMPLAHK